MGLDYVITATALWTADRTPSARLRCIPTAVICMKIRNSIMKLYCAVTQQENFFGVVETDPSHR